MSKSKQRLKRCMEVLHRVTRLVMSRADLQDVLENLVAGLGEAIEVDGIVVLTLDVNATNITRVVRGGPNGGFSGSLTLDMLQNGPWGLAIRDRKPVLLAKVAASGGANTSNTATQHHSDQGGNGSLVVAPLLADDKVRGLLSVARALTQPDFTPGEISFIEALAQHASVAIQNVELRETVRRNSDVLLAAAEVSRAGSAVRPVKEMLNGVLSILQSRLDLSFAGAFLLDAGGHWLEYVRGVGDDGEAAIPAGLRIEVGGPSLSGACAADAKPRVDLDVRREARSSNVACLQNTRSELALPLVGRAHRVIGVLTLQSEQVGAFAAEEVTALQTTADQLAMAIENAQILEQRERRSEELSVLSDLQQAFAAAPDLDTIFRSAYEQISRIFDTRDFYIATYQEGSDEWTLAFQMAHGESQPAQVLKLGQGLTGYIIQNRRALHLANLEENRAFMASQGLALVGDEALSWLGVPLITANKVVGVMAIESYDAENLFSPADQRLLTTIALQVANALEAYRLFAEVRQRAAQLETASEVARATSSILEPQMLLERAVELIRKRFGYYYVGVFLTDAERRWAVLRAGTGEAGRRMLEAGHRLEVGGASMIGACMADARARIALDVATGTVGTEAVRFDNPHLPDTHSEMAVPLRRGERVIGALTVQSSVRGAFSEEDVMLMTTIADQLAVALENARLFAASQRDAEEVNLLYRAASELRSSPDYAAILEVLRRATVLQGADLFVSVERFDRPWAPGAPAQALSSLVRWTHDGALEAFDTQYSMMLLDAAQAVRPDTPLMVPDLEVEARLGKSTRGFFQKQFGAAAFALIPLVAGGEWTGMLVAAGRGRLEFSESETRVLLSLSGQAAVALENLVRLEAILRKDVEQSALIDNIPDTVYFKDTDLRFMRVNPAQATMLGVSHPEQAIGKTDLDFFVGPSAEAAWQDDLRVVRDGEPILGRLEHIVNREGQSRWFSATKIPMRAPTGEIIGLVGISSDVTELKAMQDAAQRRALRLQQAASISRTLSAILETPALVDRAVKMVCERLGYGGAAIFLLEGGVFEGSSTSVGSQESGWLILRAAEGARAEEQLGLGARLPLLGPTPVATSVHRRELLVSDSLSLPLLDRTPDNGNGAEIALPLLRGERAVGVLCIQSTGANDFAADEVAMLQSIADQLANSLEIARLLAEADRNVRQLEAAIGAYTVDSWRDFIMKARQSRGYRFRGLDLEVATERTVEAEQAWVEGRPVVVHRSPESGAGATGGVTTMAVPIRVREQVIGVLNARSRGTSLAPDAIPLLEEVGSRLGQALETARLLEDTRARAAREQLVSTISGRVRAEVEVEPLLERALRELSHALGVRRAAVELEVKE